MTPLAPMGRGGASLVELVVAIAILGVGAGLAVRTLHLADAELDAATLGVRGVVHLAELHDAAIIGATVQSREAGPGGFVREGEGTGIRLRYEPPGDGSAESGGYFEARHWDVEVAP